MACVLHATSYHELIISALNFIGHSGEQEQIICYEVITMNGVLQPGMLLNWYTFGYLPQALDYISRTA